MTEILEGSDEDCSSSDQSSEDTPSEPRMPKNSSSNQRNGDTPSEPEIPKKAPKKKASAKKKKLTSRQKDSPETVSHFLRPYDKNGTALDVDDLSDETESVTESSPSSTALSPSQIQSPEDKAG